MFPEVGSRIVLSGVRSPDASAASTIARAIRSFVEPVGLFPSSFAHSRTPGFEDIEGKPTSGVLPIACRMSSWRVTAPIIPAVAREEAASGPHGPGAGPRRAHPTLRTKWYANVWPPNVSADHLGLDRDLVSRPSGYPRNRIVVGERERLDPVRSSSGRTDTLILLVHPPLEEVRRVVPQMVRASRSQQLGEPLVADPVLLVEPDVAVRAQERGLEERAADARRKLLRRHLVRDGLHHRSFA